MVQRSKKSLPRVLLGSWLIIIFSTSPFVWAGQSTDLASFVLPADKFSEKAAAIMNKYARENFKSATEFKLIDVRTFFEEDTPDDRLVSHKKARRLLRRGKKLVDDLELEGAISTLSESVALFKKSAGRLGKGDKYRDAVLYLGAAYIWAGDSQKGLEQFRLAALFDPSRKINQEMFPPSMIEMFQQAQKEVENSAVGEVHVESVPPAGEVYLDGVYHGVSSITLSHIPQGAHFVRIEKDGYLPWGEYVEVQTNQDKTLKAELEMASRMTKFKQLIKPLLAEIEEEKPSNKMIELIEWLGVERLVLVSVKQRHNEVEAQAIVVSANPPKRHAYRSGEFRLTSASFEKRSKAFITSLYRDVKIPPPDDSVKRDVVVNIGKCNSDSDCSTGESCDLVSGKCVVAAPPIVGIHKKWWFWAIIGGSLAAAGGTTALIWYLSQPEEGAIEFSF
jgi:hypothetical protein